MGKYTNANERCKNCKQFPANHEWKEPDRTADDTDASFEEKRTEAQYTRGANHDATTKCKGYEPSGEVG